MAIISSFISGQQEHEILKGKSGYIHNTLDFSATNVSSADVVEAIKVGIGMLVTRVSLIVTTAEGGTATCDIGDGTDPNGFDDSVNLNDTANTVTRSLEATDAYGVGKNYLAADTIDLTIDNDLDAAVVEVIAEYVRHTT